MMATSNVEDQLHSAYSFVRGVEANRAVAAITLDHLLQESLEAIQGGDTRTFYSAAETSSGRRPSKLELLAAVEGNIDQAVQALMKGAGE